MRKIAVSSLLMIFSSVSLYAAGAGNSIVYPDGERIDSPSITFFWQDERTSFDALRQLRVELVLKDANAVSRSYLFEPKKIKGYFYISFQELIDPGFYEFSLDMNRGSSPVRNSMYGYRKYPLIGRFGFFPLTGAQSDSAENIIRRYDAQHYNLIENGYNSLFYGGASILCTAAAYLLFGVFDFNWITRIAAWISAVSAVSGAGLSVYYGYRYFSHNPDASLSYPASEIKPLSLRYTADF